VYIITYKVIQPVSSHFCFSKSLLFLFWFFFPLNSASELTNLLFSGGGWEQPQHLCSFFSTFCSSSVVYIGLPAHFSSGSTKYSDAKYHLSHMAFIHLAVHTPLDQVSTSATSHCSMHTELIKERTNYSGY